MEAYNAPHSDDAPPHIWRVWAARLQQWGLEGLAAGFLEAGAPLTLASAQMLYLGQPLLDWLVPREHSDALAQLLEEDQNTLAFLHLLREGSS